MSINLKSTSKEKKIGNVYLMTHLTHFYLLLLGIGYGVNDHSDSERKPAATTTRATLFLLAINAFICTIT